MDTSATTHRNDAHDHAGGADKPARAGLQTDFGAWVAATRDPAELVLGIEGFTFADLFAPDRLAELTARFDAEFLAADAAAHATFAAYRDKRGDGMKAEDVSIALLAAAPHLSHFVAKLFGVEREAAVLIDGARERAVLWTFKKEFSKKRLFKASAGKAWTKGDAAEVAKHALVAAGADASLLGTGTDGLEESTAAAATVWPSRSTTPRARRRRPAA